ncbi:unnamed protein product [Rhizopus microsporus]
MTEILLVCRVSAEQSIAGTVDRLSDGVFGRIVDDDGNELPPGSEGELRIKGPTITLGYYNQPEATAELFDEQGYLKTGDIFKADENGLLYYVIRKKDLIKYYGINVFPAEIEEVITGHPQVTDCAVIGIFSKEGTELPRASVSLLDKVSDKVSLLKEIAEYAGSQLPDSKKLRDGIFEISSFPRTGTGNIQRLKLQTKKFYGYKKKKFINDQLEDTKSNQELNKEEEEVYPTQITEETSQETRHVQNDVTDRDPLSQSPEGEYVTGNTLQDLKLRFEQNFNAMKKEDKWYLPSGKCVEDELYAFGVQCVKEHPSHSFIIDISDKNIVKYNVFNDNELKEIESLNKKNIPRMPLTLRGYLNSFNKTTTIDIRHEIFKSQNFDENYSRNFSGDFDWITHSIYTLLRFIYRASDNLENIDVLSQGCSSVSSSKRKNKDRSIGGIEIQERKKMGYQCDMIFCESRIGHGEYIEYGALEAEKLYDGDKGTKRMEEGSKKLPKCLKDMLDHLLLKKDDRSRIQTIEFIHSGLESYFMTADRPVKYATRIIKSRRIHISNDISGFGSTTLPAVYSAWIAKEVVKKVQDVLHKPVECDNIEDSNWLDFKAQQD